MVKNIKISGVVLTRDLENYLPCYKINYYIGKDSSAVTSGKRGSRNIIYIENKKYKLNQRFEKLIKIIKKIQRKTKLNDLDVEFAINKSNKIYILQVRKLIINNRSNKLNTKLLFEKLEKDKQIKTKTLLSDWKYHIFWSNARLESCGNYWN